MTTTAIRDAAAAPGRNEAAAAPHATEFNAAAHAARHDKPAEATPPAHPPALKAALDKATAWTAQAHKLHDSIGETVANPVHSQFGFSGADMGDAKVSLNRMGIHLSKLENSLARARAPEFQHLPATEQHNVLSAVESEMGHVRQFGSEANAKAGTANGAITGGDEHIAQIGMTVTKGIMVAAPVIIGAIVEKETKSKVAGTAARDASAVIERYVASAENKAIGGSESTMDAELGSKKAVVTAAVADFALAGAMNKWKPAEGLATHLANAGGGAVKGGAKSAADAPDPLQHPAEFAVKVLSGAASGSLSEVAKIPGGGKNIKDTAWEHPTHTVFGAGAGALGAVIQGKDPLTGAVEGATKSSSKGVGEKLHLSFSVPAEKG